MNIENLLNENPSNTPLYKFIINLITSSITEKRKIVEVKLLTFPKVLGFGFNPLSIYFCYSNTGLLLHSVFEVRNTFGDIHHYILRNIQQNSDSQKTYVLTNHPQRHPFQGTLRYRGLDCFAWFQYHW